jgi:uncharacterized protein YbjT (DUF2867 family)
VLLLTGATGTIGRPLLRSLVGQGAAVRCLVRDPRRLGPDAARVEVALGDLSDPRTFVPALRGVATVVHLASVIRDQPNGSIEELAGDATCQLVRAAERAGVERFVFFSALGASPRSRARLMRAKAVAERAVIESALAHTVFAPSILYAPGDMYLTLLARMSRLPVMVIPGSGRAAFEPMWSEDVADCVIGALPGGPMAAAAAGTRYELAGPEVLTHRDIVELALRAAHRPRPIVGIPLPVVKPGLRLIERLPGRAAFATWDEAELMEVPMISQHGTADARRLGVVPHRMADVLGVASRAGRAWQ